MKFYIPKHSTARTLAIFLLPTVALLFTEALFAQTTTFNFSRNLTIGSRGEDVRELQKFLNLSPETRLALSGPGAPGEETTYFGPITYGAVIKYQEVYAAEVLFPLGLSRGTGFFGPSTRNHIHKNQNTAAVTTETEVTLPKENSIPRVSQNKAQLNPSLLGFSFFGESRENSAPTLFYPSQYDGIVGDTVTLQGLGLSGENLTLRFGATVITDLISSGESVVSFTVPHIPPGRYSVSVANSKGTSNTLNFFVRSLSVAKPNIANISPKEFVGETKVTITGTGFSQKGNTIYTGYGIIEDVPSPDETTLSFTLLPPNEAGDTSDIILDLNNPAKESDNIDDLITDVGESFDIYIVNEGGISNSVSYTYFYDKNSFK